MYMYFSSNQPLPMGSGRGLLIWATLHFEFPLLIDCLVHYNIVRRPILIDYGLWDQVRVDHGREWSIVLLVQSHLSGYRHNIVRPPYLQTSSKLVSNIIIMHGNLVPIQNHMVERFWVEVNRRVNYPIKKVAVEMVDDGDIVLSDPVHKFAISWIMLRVSDVGIKLLIEAWNNHPIPGMHSRLSILWP